MFNTKIQEYVDTQNKAYYFHCEKKIKSEVNDILNQIENTNKNIKNDIEESTKICKQYSDYLYDNIQSFIPSIENDFFIGSIISVSVICSQEEACNPYMNSIPKTNSMLENIYMCNNKNTQNQSFHWFFGKKISDPFFEELPGKWKFRGICGGFKNNIIGFKYFLAQRVK